MLNIIKMHRDNDDTEYEEADEMLVSRLPILLWVLMVYVATIILQSYIEPLFFNSLFFTITYAFHVLLHWNSHRLTRSRAWLYFLLQGLLILTCALFMPAGSPAVLIGLLPVIIGQGIGLYYQKRKILVVFLYCVLLFFYAEIYLGELPKLFLLIPLFF